MSGHFCLLHRFVRCLFVFHKIALHFAFCEDPDILDSGSWTLGSASRVLATSVLFVFITALLLLFSLALHFAQCFIPFRCLCIVVSFFSRYVARGTTAVTHEVPRCLPRAALIGRGVVHPARRHGSSRRKYDCAPGLLWRQAL